MLRAAAALAVLLSAAPSTAAPADALPGPVREVVEHVEAARRLYDQAVAARDFLYYLSDPRGFRGELYRMYERIDRDPVLGELVRNLASLYRGRVLEVRAQVHALADVETPATLGGGLGLTWDAPLCRLFEVQGSAQGFYRDGDLSAAFAWGVGGCLPLPLNTIEISYRGRRDVRRSLLAVPMPALDDERNTSDTVVGTARFYRWLSEHHQVDLMPFSIQFDWSRADGPTLLRASGSTAPARWARRGKGYAGRDQTYDFFMVRFDTLDQLGDGTGVVSAVSVSPLAVDGIRVGDDVALGLDLGWLMALGTTTADPRVIALIDASMIGGSDSVTVEVHAMNTAQPVDADVALAEQRLTGRLDLARPAAWVRFDGFAARSRLWTANQSTSPAWTWGAGGELTMLLGDHLALFIRAEVARNVVVDPAAAVTGTQLGARGTIGVSADVGETM